MITKLVTGTAASFDANITSVINAAQREPDGIFFSSSQLTGGNIMYCALLVWREGLPVK